MEEELCQHVPNRCHYPKVVLPILLRALPTRHEAQDRLRWALAEMNVKVGAKRGWWMPAILCPDRKLPRWKGDSDPIVSGAMNLGE